MKRRLPLSIAASLFFTSFVPLPAEVKVEEQTVGPANAGGVYAVSPRGVHVAYMAPRGSRVAVTIDGVEGPVFDELFEPHGQGFYSPGQVSVVAASPGGQMANTVSPVIYSADGQHYAYVGRQGNEYVVIHDGREIARGPRPSLALNYGNLTLSPTGRQVYWDEIETKGANGTWRVMMTGKPGPWSSNNNGMAVVFSGDDSRFAYNATSPVDSRKPLLVVDGKEAGYFGMSPVFTVDGKFLLSLRSATDGKPALLANGKVVAEGIQVSKVIPSPVGHGYAAIVRTKYEPGHPTDVLFLDGDEVSGTEGAQNAWFSPDGKKLAVRCVNAAANSAFMIVEGKKGNEYQGISDPGPVWSPDSAKFFYLATGSGRNFVVADGQESEGFEYLQGLLRPKIVFGEKGHHYAYATFNGMNRIFSVVVDGKSVLPPGLSPAGDSLVLSADGSRYAFMVGAIGRSDLSGMVVDGAVQEGITNYNFGKFPAMTLATEFFLFSPDGKHLAQKGRLGTDQQQTGLILDGHLVQTTPRGLVFPAFTPDSAHLFWTASELLDPSHPIFVVYVDGKPTVHCVEDSFMKTPGGWEMGSDGVFTFVAVAGDVVKRYRVTPDSSMSLGLFITEAETARAQAIADAVKAKAEADAKAAADAAQKKADAEAAAAKTKADRDAAAAARAQARSDAIAAKAKARQDAIDAKAARKNGP